MIRTPAMSAATCNSSAFPRRRPGRLGVASLLAGFACVLAANPAWAARSVTVTGVAIVRAEADLEGPVVAIVRRGEPLRIENEVGPWMRVATAGGAVGFTAGRIDGAGFTTDETLAPPPFMPSAFLSVPLGGSLNVSPASGSRGAGDLKEGSVVRAFERHGLWVSVAAADGTSGWLQLGRVPVARAKETDFAAASAAVAAANAETGARPAAEPRHDQPTEGSAERLAYREKAAADRAAEAGEKKAADEAARAAAREAAAKLAAEKKAADEAVRAAARDAAAKLAAEKKAADEAAREAAANVAAEKKAADTAARAAARDAAAKEAAEKKAADAAARAAEREAVGKTPAENDAPSGGQSTAGAAPAASGGEDKAAAREAEAAARAAEKEAAAKLAAEKRAADEAARAAEKEAAAQLAAEKKAADETARAAEKEAAATRAADKQGTESARAADRKAREEAEAAQRADLERRLREAAEAPQGPIVPAEIPAAVVVPGADLKAKPKVGADKKNPHVSPLTGDGAAPIEMVAGPRSPATAGAGGEVPAGFEPYDPAAQLARSVGSLHEEGNALDLSTERRKELATERPSYIDAAGAEQATSVVSQIVARVNDEILTNADFERKVLESLDDMRRTDPVRAAQANQDAVRRRVLQRSIEQMLLLDQAKVMGMHMDKVYEQAKERFMKQAGIKDDLELLQLLDASNRTWDDFRRELLWESVPPAILQREVFTKVTVSEEEIASHYRLHQEEWAEPACVRLREIVLQPDAKETTKAFNLRLDGVLDRLDAGDDFCAVARDASAAASREACGLLADCFTSSQLDERVAGVAFRMQPGDIEPVTTDWGYHVIRLEELRPRQQRGLDAVRDDVLEKLRVGRANEEVRRYIDTLRESAKVEIAPEYGQLLERPMSGGTGQ